MKGKIHSINISATKHITKAPVEEAKAIENFGLESDAHAGDEIRQISLLAQESIDSMKESAKIKQKQITLNPGDFAENITTKDIDLRQLKIGDTLKAGEEVILEVSKIGKTCHAGCKIFQELGECVMPKEGIFVKVIKGGTIKQGDTLQTLDNQ